MTLLVDEKSRTAILPLPGAERLPELLDLDGERWSAKKELHVTFVGSRPRLDPAALRAAAHGLTFAVAPTGIFRRLDKDGRRALIELVEVRGQEEFYVRLENVLRLPSGHVPRMPAHVTYYTEPGGRGIALYSKAELDELSRATAWSPEAR